MVLKKKKSSLYICVKKLKTEGLLKIIPETCMIIITQGGKKKGWITYKLIIFVHWATAYRIESLTLVGSHRRFLSLEKSCWLIILATLAVCFRRVFTKHFLDMNLHEFDLIKKEKEIFSIYFSASNNTLIKYIYK